MSSVREAPKYKRPPMVVVERSREERILGRFDADDRDLFRFSEPVKLRAPSKGRRLRVVAIEPMGGYWRVTEAFSVRTSEEVRLLDGRSLDVRNSEIEERTRDVFDADEIDYLQRCMETGRRPDI